MVLFWLSSQEMGQNFETLALFMDVNQLYHTLVLDKPIWAEH